MTAQTAKKVKPKPAFRLEEVGPRIAAEYLEHNRSNRPIRQRHVKALARQMEKGLWMATDQGIGFDWNGHLTNGQHRLMAIIESGKTIEIMVARNLDPGAKTVTDRDQVSRSAADVFYMRGVAGSDKCKTIQAAINVMHRFSVDGRYRNSRDKLTQDQYDAYYDHYPQIMRWVDWVHRDRASAGIQRATLVGLGVVFQLSEEGAGVDANVFMEQLAHGAGLEEGSPIIVLRERLMRSAYDRESRLTPHACGWLVIKTWNAVANNETIKSLKIHSNENPPRVVGFDATRLPFYGERPD